MKLSTHFFNYNKTSRCFVVEISEISSLTKGFKPKDGITLNNPTTDTKKFYKFTKADLNKDHEIGGWRFTNEETRTTILIIND